MISLVSCFDKWEKLVLNLKFQIKLLLLTVSNSLGQ